jgi:FeS assembly protein IscX
MAKKTLKWGDADEIGIALLEENPDIDPLSVSFVQLKRLILELDVFEDEPNGSNEKVLEAIQMAWWDEWKIDND